MEHAHVLGQYDNDIYAQYHKIMAWLGTWPADMNALLECSMEIGQMNFKVMSILDAGETGKYGHPTPTQVNVKATAGKCILISGHDLKDLYNLLEQTEGTGVNVYTHGEMLPAHGYPELRKFKHLVGNYGSGWQNQQVEFARFPGPIVMTSNCIIDPTVGAYDDRDLDRQHRWLAGCASSGWRRFLCGHYPGATNGRLPVQRNSAPDHRGLWSSDAA